MVLFSYIIGNADMHLKNFSMYETDAGGFVLSPAYDFVSTFLVIENEDEQMSLSINGKKNKISRKDFDNLALNLNINEKQKGNSYIKFLTKNKNIEYWINNSFLPSSQKAKLLELIKRRINSLKQ